VESLAEQSRGTDELNSASGLKPSGRLRELDGWRAISVFLVILFHVFSIQYVARMPHVFLVSHMIAGSGDLGVKVFFVISGFVICRLLILEEASYGFISLTGFYYRRIFRILPPLFLYLAAVSLCLGFGLIHEHWKSIMGSALFLYDLSAVPWSWHVGQTWSLAVEEQFYLLFPSLWILIPKPWRSRFFAGILLLCVSWNLAVILTQTPSFLWTRAREGFACISFGVLMAMYEDRARRVTARVPAFLAALIALALLMRPLLSPAWHLALIEGLLVPPAIGLLLLVSLRPRTALSAILCSPPIQAVGLTSYGIYLWQQLFTGSKEDYTSAGQIIPLLIPLMFVIVPASYWLIEKPAVRYGRFLSDRARRRMTT
jgi:peptidoglycan/LPS O-acetylase OafA/YrhL